MTSTSALVILLFMFLLRFSHCDDVITTIAGTGSATYSGDNAAATSAGLNSPRGVDVDAAGDSISDYSRASDLTYYLLTR